MSAVIWRPRPSRRERRFRDVEQFPYIVRYGNHRLAAPYFRRTFIGARLTAWWLRQPVHWSLYHKRWAPRTIHIEQREAARDAS